MKAFKFFCLVGVITAMSLIYHRHSSPRADDASNIGSSKCKMCHSPIAKMWVTTKHAALKPEDADSEGMKHRKATGFDPATGQPNEPGVACEACHGPGSVHMKATTATRKTTIVNPATLDPAKEAMVCGQCHATGKSKNGKDYLEGFKPGDDLSAVFTLEQCAQHNKQTIYNEWVGSKHAAKGNGCAKCHEPHGASGQPHQLRSPINDLCGGCHEKNKDIKTHQPDAPANATCATCHMPGGVHNFTQDVAKQGKAALKG